MVNDYLNERTGEEFTFSNILAQVHTGRTLYLDCDISHIGVDLFYSSFYNYSAVKLNIYD